MTQAQAIAAVLDQLQSALGLGEYPNGSNSNYIVDWYNKEVDPIGNGPWCEMTNTWGVWTAGFKDLKVGRAYTVWACEDGINGRLQMEWHYGTAGMRSGDQVYYDWSGKKGNYRYVDHTGTVKVVYADGTFKAYEGNTTGNKLLLQHRDSKYVVGYVRLAWANAAGGGGGMTAPINRPKPSGKRILDEDGKFGPATARRAQQVFGTEPDGEVSNQSYWIRDHNPGLKARDNWKFNGTDKGSDLIRAIQRMLSKKSGKARYSGKIDGLAGPNFWYAFQSWLGLSFSPNNRNITDPSETIKAFQRWLNKQK